MPLKAWRGAGAPRGGERTRLLARCNPPGLGGRRQDRQGRSFSPLFDLLSPLIDLLSPLIDLLIDLLSPPIDLHRAQIDVLGARIDSLGAYIDVLSPVGFS